MPKIFLASSIQETHTYRVVIDGQQRITAILDFLSDDFSLQSPYDGPYFGKTFSELDEDTQDLFLRYRIDFNEAQNATDEETREVYSRVNKYTVPLTKQELRRADFPGDFLTVAEECALNEYFDEAKIFTLGSRRRYGDVEYVSELLAGMLDGIQDKKTTLDDFYIKYSKWDSQERQETQTRFDTVLREISDIFSGDLSISKSRFRQKADFYTLFLVINEFVVKQQTIRGKDTSLLQADLELLQEHIRPESTVFICREYAIKCVSQANSASSRRWRHRFLKPIIAGTFVDGLPEPEDLEVVYRVKEDLYTPESLALCPPPMIECEVCDEVVSPSIEHCVLGWPMSAKAHQIENAEWIHRSCASHFTEHQIPKLPIDGQRNLL